MENQIEINGKPFKIIHLRSDNRHASARLKGDQIVIKVPHRWHTDPVKTAKELEQTAIKNILKGRWKNREMKRISFSDGQEFEILGRKFIITNPSDSEKIAKGIMRKILPDIEARVKRFNDAYFQSSLKRIFLRDNTSRWGSYSTKGSIGLNFRLLFAPVHILDYVIVHELAHSKYRSHGPRFWALVENVMPDYKERRKWLKENADKIGP